MTADSYLIDLECLREMFFTVLPVLQERDSARVKEIEAILDDARVINDDDGKKSVTLTNAAAKEMALNVRKLRRAESIFRREAIVSLVSRFDEFLSAILKVVLRENPEWLKSNTKTLTYKELIELDSVKEAITGIIEKEVDELMRGSKEEQINFLDSKLKLGIKDNFTKFSEFLEIAERRNLFAHTGGRVSQQYLDRCKKYGIRNPEDVRKGALIEISDDYFSKAFDLFFEAGLRVSQAAFRRMFPGHLRAADRSLNHLAIRFLDLAEWELAELISDFFVAVPEQLRSEDVEFYYFALINRAIAQKASGKKVEPGLAGVPWEAFHPKYKLALHVLRDEFDEAAKLCRNQAVIEAVTENGFREWPLFRTFRETAQFADAYKETFGRDFRIGEAEVESALTESSDDPQHSKEDNKPVDTNQKPDLDSDESGKDISEAEVVTSLPAPDGSP